MINRCLTPLASTPQTLHSKPQISFAHPAGVLRLLAGDHTGQTTLQGQGAPGGEEQGVGGGEGAYSAALVVEAWHRVPRDVLEPDG